MLRRNVPDSAGLNPSETENLQQDHPAAEPSSDLSPPQSRILSDEHPLTNAEANAGYPVTFGASVLVTKDEQTGLLTIPRFRIYCRNVRSARRQPEAGVQSVKEWPIALELIKSKTGNDTSCENANKWQ